MNGQQLENNTNGMVARPLVVNGQTLFTVVCTWRDESKPNGVWRQHIAVFARDRNEAVKIVGGQYCTLPEGGRPGQVRGYVLNVLQPKEWNQS